MASIQGIYLAFFGRPADPLGLEYWEEQTNGGADLSVMLDALSGTEEYQDRFVGMDNEQIIESIYQALFGREADPEGLAVFLEALENGTQTLSSIAVNILDGAQGEDLAMIENKIAAADIFTASLDTEAEIAAYDGNEAAAYGREFLSTVTEDPETVPTEEEVQADIDADLPDYTPEEGQAPGGGGGGAGGPTLGQIAAQIEAEWRELDAAYNDTPEVNEAFVLLGNRYVDYLNAGGSPIEEIGKDETNRAQTVHDNLLSNLTNYAVRQRTEAYSSSPDDAKKGYQADIRSDAAKEFGLRPQNQGYTNDAGNHDAFASAAWDLEHYPQWGPVDQNGMFEAGNVYVVNFKQFAESDGNATTPTVDVYDNAEAAFSDLDEGDIVVFGGGAYEGLFEIPGDANGVMLLGANDAVLVGGVKVGESEGHDFDGLEIDATLFNLTGEVGDANETPGESPYWQVDRSSLLSINIEGADDKLIAFTLDPEQQDEYFYGYAGSKYVPASGEFFDGGHGSSVSYSFFIDEDWNDDGTAQRSGVWIQMQDEEKTLDSGGRFSIAEYLDADAVAGLRDADSTIPTDFVEGFRFWNVDGGWENYIGHSGSGWVDLEFVFGSSELAWSVNGEEVYVDAIGDHPDELVALETIIVNSRANGTEGTYYYDDIKLTGVPFGSEDFYAA